MKILFLFFLHLGEDILKFGENIDMNCPETPNSIIGNIINSDRNVDQASWTSFYNIYQKTVRAMAVKSFKKLGWNYVNENDVSDIVADAFISVFKAFEDGTYKPEQFRFRGFLKRIVYTRIIDFIRRQNKISTVSIEALNIMEALSDSQAENGLKFFDDLEESEAKEYHKAVINDAYQSIRLRFDPQTQMCFSMRALDDIPVEEICRQLKVGRGKVDKSVYKITKEIKKELNSEYYQRELQK